MGGRDFKPPSKLLKVVGSILEVLENLLGFFSCGRQGTILLIIIIDMYV